MKRRHRNTQPESLTSLLDTLFILIFAALVQLAASQGQARAAASKPRVPDALPPPVPADRAALRSAALDTLARDLADRTTVIARVSSSGVLTAFELEQRAIPIGVPLLEHVPDPDVALAYLGDRFPELRICRAAALRLGSDRLDNHLIVIAPDAPIAQLTVALVAGLRRDAERCGNEQGAIAVLVDPQTAVVPPEAP